MEYSNNRGKQKKPHFSAKQLQVFSLLVFNINTSWHFYSIVYKSFIVIYNEITTVSMQEFLSFCLWKYIAVTSGQVGMDGQNVIHFSPLWNQIVCNHSSYLCQHELLKILYLHHKSGNRPSNFVCSHESSLLCLCLCVLLALSTPCRLCLHLKICAGLSAVTEKQFKIIMT